MNLNPIHIDTIDHAEFYTRIEEFEGRTIAAVHFGMDKLGYHVAEIICTDGSRLMLEETGQCGEIVWSASLAPDPIPLEV
jgi:hypothetical protein